MTDSINQQVAILNSYLDSNGNLDLTINDFII